MYLTSRWGFDWVPTQILGISLTTLRTSISFSLLYIVTSIVLLQTWQNSGIYTFSAHGQISHNIGCLGEKMVRSQDILSFTSTTMIQALSTAIDDVVKRSAKKTRKSLRGLWPSFMTTHTHNILECGSGSPPRGLSYHTKPWPEARPENIQCTINFRGGCYLDRGKRTPWLVLE